MAVIPNDVFFATVTELNARLKAREFKADDLSKAFSGRLAQLGPHYNALALPLEKEAHRQARAVDQDLKIDRLRGPLQGIPYDHLGRAAIRRTGIRFQRHHHRQAGRGGRSAHREAGDGGTGGRRRVPLRLGVPHGAGAKSLGPYPLGGRIVERIGGRGGGGAGDVRHRVGDLGFDYYPGVVLRSDGAAADLRAGQPPWRHGARLDAR
jgi:hypothetical protein